MPPKKRTSQSKRTPPTSPTTSTSHVPADQHHHLRHTGPSISTRPGVGAAPSKPPHATQLTPESPSTQQGHREKKLLAEVAPPGARVSFTKFMYVLLSLALLFLVWYVYGMVTLFERLKDEVGWWGVIVGDSGVITRWEALKGWGFGWDRSGGTEAAKGGDLEGSLNALADALGISPVQVASAVKPLIPQASLTNIASKETGGSEAVRILYEDTTRNGRDKSGTTGVAEESAGRLAKGSDEEEVAEGGMV